MYSLFGASLNPKSLFRRRSNAHFFGDALRTLRADVFEYNVSFSETELRAAKPNFHRGRLAPALESRGANLRSRKLDEKLSRDVARARRVALLAPRATFTQYRYPLSYVSARLKLF